jgi:RNA polymerase sigma-70 factor (ECF subfamily)
MENALAISIKDDGVRGETGYDALSSLAALAKAHGQLAYRVALAVTRNRQDAEDAVQEAFLQLHRGGRWDEIAEPRSYLARVTWRMAVRRRRPHATEQAPVEEIVSLAASPEKAAMEREQEAWLHGAIDRLPEKLRQPLALAALGELKLVEVARILGLPEGTVRRRIHSARQRLKQEMDRRERRSR